MKNYFEGWEQFELDGATVSFYKKSENGTIFIGFDSSSCTPPGPMVNASVALNLVKDKNTKVVMINHKFPVGLIPKIEDMFDYTNENLEDGKVKLVFSLKDEAKYERIDDTCGSFAKGTTY